jgi:hypothetical protein
MRKLSLFVSILTHDTSISNSNLCNLFNTRFTIWIRQLNLVFGFVILNNVENTESTGCVILVVSRYNNTIDFRNIFNLTMIATGLYIDDRPGNPLCNIRLPEKIAGASPGQIEYVSEINGDYQDDHQYITL